MVGRFTSTGVEFNGSLSYDVGAPIVPLGAERTSMLIAQVVFVQILNDRVVVVSRGLFQARAFGGGTSGCDAAHVDV